MLVAQAHALLVVLLLPVSNTTDALASLAFLLAATALDSLSILRRQPFPVVSMPLA